MLIKWIVCQVPPAQREAFSTAQQEWSAIAAAPGFLGQHGGWDVRSPEPRACILAAWSSEAAYSSFMQRIHDGVTQRSEQHRTYTAITVDLLDAVVALPGTCPGLLEGLAAGHRFLRVAECDVRPERAGHFVEVQSRVWLPAMRETQGMGGGAFLRSRSQAHRWVVLSCWASAELHEAYASTRVPRLRQEADVAGDVRSICGRFVPLEANWSVRPAQP